MDSMRQGHFDIAGLHCSALAHARDVLQTFRRQPQIYFVDADNPRLVLPAQRNGIAQMIAMAMRKQNHIHARRLFQLRRAGWVAFKPGVNQDDVPSGRYYAKCTVTEPGYLIAVSGEQGRLRVDSYCV